MQIRTSLGWSVISLALVAGVASAQSGLTFFAFGDETLFRFSIDDSGVSVVPVEEFDLDTFDDDSDITVITSTIAPDGTFIGYGGQRGDDQFHETWELTDPFGASPTLVQTSQSNGSNIPISLTYIDGVAYGYDNKGNGLTIYDGTTLDEISIVGTTTIAGLDPNDPDSEIGGNGLAYDEANDIIYGLSGGNDAAFIVDLTDLSNTIVIGGEGSIGFDFNNGGLEFVDGVLYAAVQNLETGTFQVGSIDTTTGEFDLIADLGSWGTELAFQVSLTVVPGIVPTPGAVGAIGLAGLIAIRRRR